MASIHRKAGASGKTSPFWQAKFRGADGRTIWRSTKRTDHRKAIAVARKWEANGGWVSPLEPEALLNQHPAVAESAIVGVREEHDLLQIKAVVVLRPGGNPPI